jgi:hypothetical protein
VNVTANTWSPAASTLAERDSPTATLLPNGTVLLTGGTATPPTRQHRSL